ncbi:S49 family peptidase [Armatimonas rosea]|uniref:Signal peptide peptidase SppA n=1 Tax=Armatimonas rosea TaxID=685828 RepID=A0A7W9W9I9_ARMRO|nr:S49 family peptidase [Armatimonas rosea]MBB6053265.1 signal peptide peptidase SppA [Armatimonas rosea]
MTKPATPSKPPVPPANRLLAISLALEALSGPLALWQPACNALMQRLASGQTTGETVAFWNDDEDEDEPESGYEVFGQVALIPVSGVLLPTSSWWMRYLGFRSTPEIAEAIKRAQADANIKTILLKIESPGGAVQGIAELADTVKACDKRIIAYTGGVCASAALWVASQCDKVYASRLADVGCIGTLRVVSDWSQYYKAMGVTVNAITSTGAESFKGMGVNGTPLTDEQKADLKRNCDESQVHFTQAIADGFFGGDLAKAQAIATGQVWVGPAAKAQGIAHEIVLDTFDTWLQKLSDDPDAELDEDGGTDATKTDDDDTTSDEDDDMPGSRRAELARSGDNTGNGKTAAQTQPGSGKRNEDPQENEMDEKTQDSLASKIVAGLSGLFKSNGAKEAATTPPADPLAERKDALKKSMVAALGQGHPQLTALAGNVDAITEEGALTALEAAWTIATPEALKQTTRASHSQRLDDPSTAVDPVRQQEAGMTAQQKADYEYTLNHTDLGRRARNARKEGRLGL